MRQKDAGPVLGGNEARDNLINRDFNSPPRAGQEQTALPPIYLLRLRTAPGRDPVRALKALLKYAWRCLGLRCLSLEHECALPQTWRTLTGGGEHIIFSCPDGVSIKNYSHTPVSGPPPLGPGIDIRARGGYIVAPPSRHISGRRYEFSVDHHPQDTRLAPLPEWLAERLTAPRGATHGDHDDGDGDRSIAPIPGDQWARLTSQPISEYRDQAALSIVGHLFRHNVNYDLVRGMLHA
jgi:Bifunctional DNA primase/polymerase, N-terminal